MCNRVKFRVQSTTPSKHSVPWTSLINVVPLKFLLAVVVGLARTLSVVICLAPKVETQWVKMDLATNGNGIFKLKVSREAYPFAFPPLVWLKTTLITGPFAVGLHPAKTLVATLTRKSLSLFPPYLTKIVVTLLIDTLRHPNTTLQVLVTNRTLLHLTLPRITPMKRLVLLPLTHVIYGLLLGVPVETRLKTGVIRLQVLCRFFGTTEGFPKVFLLLLEIFALTKPTFEPLNLPSWWTALPQKAPFLLTRTLFPLKRGSNDRTAPLAVLFVPITTTTSSGPLKDLMNLLTAQAGISPPLGPLVTIRLAPELEWPNIDIEQFSSLTPNVRPPFTMVTLIMLTRRPDTNKPLSYDKYTTSQLQLQ